jgi:tetratricopeptide (TPR) repeat protein
MATSGRDRDFVSGPAKSFSFLALVLLPAVFVVLPLADATAYRTSESMSPYSISRSGEQAGDSILMASEPGHGPPRRSGGWGIGIRIRLTPKAPAKIKDPFDDDFFKDEEPSKPQTQPQPRAKIKTAPRAETRPDHPETEGSAEARSYLLESAMGFGRELAYAVWNDSRATLKKYEDAAKQAKTNQDTEAQVEAETSLGHVYYLLGLFAKSERSYQEALRVGSEGGDTGRQALLVNNLGAVGAASGKYEEALKYYHDAIERFGAVSNSQGMGMTLNNLGVLHKSRGQLSASLSYFQNSLDFSQLFDELKIRTLTNMAETYRRWGLYEPAEKSLTGALEIAGKIKSDEARVEKLMDLAQVYRDWGKRDDAVASLERAISIRQTKDDRLYRINNLMGTVYLDVGNVRKAEPYLKQAKYNSGLGRLYLMKAEL